MNKMKALREKNGYTQEKFAELLGVAIATVQAWEQKISKPGLRSKKDIMRVLKVDVDELFKDEIEEILRRR